MRCPLAACGGGRGGGVSGEWTGCFEAVKTGSGCCGRGVCERVGQTCGGALRGHRCVGWGVLARKFLKKAKKGLAIRLFGIKVLILQTVSADVLLCSN